MFSDSDDDIFGNKSTVVEKKQKQISNKNDSNTIASKPSSNIFSSPSDDDDLFSSPKPVKNTAPTNTVPETKSKISNETPQIPKSVESKPQRIYKTEDSEDDLFSDKPKKPQTSTTSDSLPKLVKPQQSDNDLLFVPPPLPTSNDGKSNSGLAKNSSIFSSGSSDEDIFGTVTKPTLSKANEINSSQKNSQNQVKQFSTNPRNDVPTPKLPNDSNEPEIKIKQPEKLSAPKKTGIFSSPSDDDDLFGPPPLPNTNKNVAKNSSKTLNADTKEVKKSIFSSGSSEEDLFSSKPNSIDSKPKVVTVINEDKIQKDLSAEVKKTNESSKKDNISGKETQNIENKKLSKLFDSIDDEDDIFAGMNSDIKPKRKQLPVSNSLLGSNDDNDDLFSSNSTKKSPDIFDGAFSSKKKIPKPNVVGKSFIKKDTDILPPKDIPKTISKPKPETKPTPKTKPVPEDKPTPKSSTNAIIDNKEVISTIVDDKNMSEKDIMSTQKQALNLPNKLSESEPKPQLPDKEHSPPKEKPTDSDVPASKTEGNENKTEISSIQKRKKPVGGVSLFGGSELFAKINQRKSMVGNDVSDDSGAEETLPDEKQDVEEKVNETSNKVVVEPIEKKEKPKNLSSTNNLKPPTLEVPQSSSETSPISDDSVSFDVPVSTSTLQSLNKVMYCF